MNVTEEVVATRGIGDIEQPGMRKRRPHSLGENEMANFLTLTLGTRVK